MSLAAGASERADAEKDAALTDKYLDKLFFWMCAHHRDGHLKGFKEFARAILTANGETPDERAEPRALTDARAKEIAQQVHAECSRIPGATFYNAAMSAIEQAVKERK
jgi:hypothetical protein